MADLKLALHMNDDTLIDSSTYGHTITLGGNAKVDYLEYKFGPGSAYFDGNNDFLSINNGAGNLDFGTGDFTIHAWIRLATSATATRRIVDFRQAGTTEVQITFTTDSSSKLTYYVNGSVRIQGDTVLVAETWYHVALVRTSGTTKMYLNGSQEGGNYADGNNFGSATTVYVGNNYASSGDYKGHIDELIMYGIALDAGTFPPTEQLDTGHTTEAQTAGVVLQTEIVVSETKVAGIVLQVEIDVPTYAGPEPHTAKIEVFELQSNGGAGYTLEAGTDTDDIVIIGHGLSESDMMLNVNRIGYDTGGGTYVNGYGATEPGCRRIKTVTNVDSCVIEPALTGQTDGDVVYLYKWIDRTEYVKEGTLSMNLKAGGQSDASFDIVCAKPFVSSLDYKIIPGSLVRISLDDEIRIMGVAMNAGFRSDIVVNAVFQSIQLAPMISIAARRTTNINAVAGDTYGDIVQDMVDLYLIYEGITAGTIDTGATLVEDWSEDKINIATILEECAKKSGYQCFIDENKQLQFYQDPASITLAPHDIDDSAANTFDINNISADTSMDNYTNKTFVVGGNDAYGNQIYTAQTDLTETARMKTYTSGTGTWGSVHNDSSLESYEYKTSEAGTDTDTIKITGHGLNIGDMIYNVDRDKFAYVWAVTDANTVEVEPPVTSQTAGDVIEIYPANYLVSQNILKLQSIEPCIVEFDTSQISFSPQQKMGIKLTRFGMDTVGYYNIDTVSIQEVAPYDDTGWLFKSHVVAVKRNNANFSTQKLRNYIQYYNSIVARKPGYNGNRGAINPKRTVSDTAPLYPRNGDEWLDIGSSPAVNKWWDAAGATWQT